VEIKKRYGGFFDKIKYKIVKNLQCKAIVTFTQINVLLNIAVYRLRYIYMISVKFTMKSKKCTKFVHLNEETAHCFLRHKEIDRWRDFTEMSLFCIIPPIFLFITADTHQRTPVLFYSRYCK
jgi:hypothetical protein